MSVAEMREIDRIAAQETGPGLLQMMENAGRSLAELTLSLLESEAAGATVVVLAGTGGNGGGGICGARHLASRVKRVRLCLTDPSRIRGAAARQLQTYRRCDGELVWTDALESSDPDLIVDAVLGYGIVGEPRGAAGRLVSWAEEREAPVLSLDVPSGLDPDSGRTADPHIEARWTLTLHLPKAGLAHPAAGELFLADLGIPRAVTGRMGLSSPRFGSAFWIPLRRG